MRVSPRRLAAIASLTAALTTSARAQVAPATRTTTIDAPRVDYTEFTLPNGLRVLLHEDHSSPLVAVEVWYGVGYKNDPEGRTGLAHLFEHMMFEGTKNVKPNEHLRIIQEAGGAGSAATSEDQTRYHQVVPASHLETALWLEAERMTHLLPGLDSVRFERARGAVDNEFRLRNIEVASGAARAAIVETLFADGIYGRLGIGYHRELFAATVEDAREIYDRYYVPNNAVLVVAGDISPALARTMIARHFGPIPRGAPKGAVQVGKSVTGERRVALEHPTNVRALWVAWNGAPAAAPDRLAAVALSSILTERVKRALDRQGITSTLSASLNGNFDLVHAAVFEIAVTLNATAGTATQVERVVDSVVASIREQGVTDAEVKRWGASFRLQALTDIQAVEAKARSLGDAMLNQNKPLGIIGMAAETQSLRPAAVQAAARKYLTADRVVLSIVPRGKFDMVSKPELPWANKTLTDSSARLLGNPGSARSAGHVDGARRDAVVLRPRPAPAPPKRYAYPDVRVDSLPNGLRFAVIENHEVPLVSVRLVSMGAGPREVWYIDPPGKAGAWGLMLMSLQEGTTTRSAAQIAGEFAELGATPAYASATLFTPPSFRSTRSAWESSLGLLADMAMHPAFPAERFEQVKAGLLTVLNRNLSLTTAYGVAHSTLYGSESKGAQLATAASVRTLTRDDIVAIHREYMRSQNTVIVIGGDVSPAEARAAMLRAFGAWERGGTTVQPTVPATATPAPTTIYLKDSPNLAQSVVMLGQLVPGRENADAPALELLPAILRGSGGRVDLASRDNQALAYIFSTAIIARPAIEMPMFVTFMPVSRANTDTAVTALLRVLREVKTRPITEAELDFGKMNAFGRLPMQTEQIDLVTNSLMTTLRNGYPADNLNRWIGRLAAVTLPQLHAAIDKHLDPEHMAIIVVADRASLEARLRAIGVPVVIVP